MTLVLENTRTNLAERRDAVRASIGRKTPAEIREWAANGTGRDWALDIADRLAVSGYLTLADVTDSEFDSITR
jgi:hypothetical protein